VSDNSPRLTPDTSLRDTMALVDCYAELITYTGYLLRNWRDKPFGFEEVSKNYQGLIARGHEAASAAGLSREQWTEGLFPVCAWVDETILCSGWPERAKWEHAQLQREYFHTTHGGAEFFQRMEGLGEGAGELREVYAYCLALGFKGSYYRDSDLEKLKEIGSRNLQGLGADLTPLFPQALFPEAYEAAAGKKKRRRLRWRRLSPFAISVFLLPIVIFAGLFILYNNMLSDEVASYLGLEKTPIYKTPIFRDRIPFVGEKLGLTLSHEKPGDQKVHGEKKHPEAKKEEHPAAKGHYTVGQGDSLVSIASQEKVYGDPLKWPVLYRHNLQELGELRGGTDLPERHLHPGLRLRTVRLHEYEVNLKKRSTDLYVVNVLSTAHNEKAVQAAVQVIQMGYPAYLTKAKSEGKEWIRLRVGFFKTQAEADVEGKKIQTSLRLPKIWTAKVAQHEFEKYAGY
jgi:type VI secretion system protein ImpK